MKIVVACDSFKGTFSSEEIAEVIAECVKKRLPEAEVLSFPVSDGGEGVVEVLKNAMHGTEVTVTVTDPNFEQTDAKFILCGDVAVIESAQACGITMSKPLDTKKKTTYGVGEMIKAAYARGAKRVLLGLGGTGTTDAGCGMAAALGTTFFDKEGKLLVPVGETLKNINAINVVKTYDVTALCDVKNPLYGENGAAYIYGPQKGATPSDVVMLDEGLKHVSEIIGSEGYRYSQIAGAGAAGGLGFGVLAFCNGKLRRGIDVVLDELGFDEVISGADYIVTGEGALDHQSFCGKVVDGILSRAENVPVIGFVGINKISDADKKGLCAVFETNDKHLPFAEIQDQLETQLIDAAERLAAYVSQQGE